MKPITITAALLIGASIAAVSAGQASATLNPSASPATSPADSDNSDYLISMRRYMGLKADKAAVENAKTKQFPSYNGVPMSPGERGFVESQEARTEALGRTSERLTLSDPTFAGVRQDPDNPLRYVASFTGTPAEGSREDLVGQGRGARIDFEVAKFSLQEIVRVDDRLGEIWSTLAGEGIIMASHGQRPLTNTVDVVVNSDVDVAVRRLTELTDAPAGLLRVTYLASGSGFDTNVNRNRLSGPAFGGLFNTLGGGCTLGFSMLRSNSDGKTFSVSAGHCANGNEGGATVRMGISTASNGTALGPVHRNLSIGGTTNCDCALIGPIPGANVTARVLIDNDNIFQYTSTGTGSSYGVSSSPVYLSGARTFTSGIGRLIRGTIAGTASYVISDTNNASLGTTVSDQVLVNHDAQPLDGDSGGPWGRGGMWMGLQSASSPSQSLFSKSSNIGVFNVTPFFTQ